jgi:sugar phosphate isomerase/epimerase
MRLAYNTNGFPHHELTAVIDVLAEQGYAGIAITPDVFHLNPFVDTATGRREVKARLAETGLAVAVETGARFVLDRGRKHRPTLLDGPEGAARRLDYLKRSLDLAVELSAETLSFWSGAAPDGLGADAARDRLCAGASALLDAAVGSSVTVCFEPEPGMAVASLAELDAFVARLARPELKLMLDVGHVPVTESVSPAEVIRGRAASLGGVQLDDSRDGVHEHLFFGVGEIDFDAVRAALREVGFTGLAAVELPRHDHDPVTTAARAAAFFGAGAPPA